MIASHYAVPVERSVRQATALHLGPSEDSPAIRNLGAGEPFSVLDESVGWAWGYAGDGRRVGYARSGDLED